MTLTPALRRLALLGAACAALAACQSAGPAGGPATKGEDPAAFMARNGAAPGVISADGIEYSVIKSGPVDGPHPRPQDDVTVDYEGRLLSGKVFDTTFGAKPVTFQLGQLIPGWITALQLMRPGDEWKLYIPPQLAYGDADQGPIPGGSLLVFDIRLVAVTPHG
jgi:peptidylprolyl isomerase/FKBP-type peptidyl-prolyl cis-trans isomerase FklB